MFLKIYMYIKCSNISLILIGKKDPFGLTLFRKLSNLYLA